MRWVNPYRSATPNALEQKQNITMVYTVADLHKAIAVQPSGSTIRLQNDIRIKEPIIVPEEKNFSFEAKAGVTIWPGAHDIWSVFIVKSAGNRFDSITMRDGSSYKFDGGIKVYEGDNEFTRLNSFIDAKFIESFNVSGNLRAFHCQDYGPQFFSGSCSDSTFMNNIFDDLIITNIASVNNDVSHNMVLSGGGTQRISTTFSGGGNVVVGNRGFSLASHGTDQVGLNT